MQGDSSQALDQDKDVSCILHYISPMKGSGQNNVSCFYNTISSSHRTIFCNYPEFLKDFKGFISIN